MWDKADIVPTPLFIIILTASFWGLGWQMNQPVIMNVANKKEKPCYLHPQMDVLFIETSKHLLSGSGDPTITNPDMGWGARDFETLESIEKIKSILE